MKIELLPCPFCSGDDLYQSSNGVDSYFVGCHQCGAEGPVALSAVLSGKDDATAQWNRRATQPAAGKPITGEELYNLHKASSQYEMDAWEDVPEFHADWDALARRVERKP